MVNCPPVVCLYNCKLGVSGPANFFELRRDVSCELEEGVDDQGFILHRPIHFDAVDEGLLVLWRIDIWLARGEDLKGDEGELPADQLLADLEDFRAGLVEAGARVGSFDGLTLLLVD